MPRSRMIGNSPKTKLVFRSRNWIRNPIRNRIPNPIRNLISSFYEINENTDDEGRTPLYTSIRLGQLEEVKFLIQQQPNLLLDLTMYLTPLTWAAYHGRTEILEWLCRYDFRVDGTPGASSPIHFALLNYNFPCVRILRAVGARTDRVGFTEDSPLSPRQMQVLTEPIPNILEIRARIYFDWTLLDRLLERI